MSTNNSVLDIPLYGKQGEILSSFSKEKDIDRNIIISASCFYATTLNAALKNNKKEVKEFIRIINTAAGHNKNIIMDSVSTNSWAKISNIIDALNDIQWINGKEHKFYNNRMHFSLAFTTRGLQCWKFLSGLLDN